MIGIYKITNPKGEIYVGQSSNISNRFSVHKYCFNKKIKQYGKLQDSFLKYGLENHVFEIIEQCSKDLLNIREKHWQLFYDSISKGLNCVTNSVFFTKV